MGSGGRQRERNIMDPGRNTNPMAAGTTGEMERERRVQVNRERITMVDWREREINEHESTGGDGEGRFRVACLSSPEREELVSNGDRFEAAKRLYTRITIQDGDTTIRGNDGTTGRPNDHRRYQGRVLLLCAKTCQILAPFNFPAICNE